MSGKIGPSRSHPTDTEVGLNLCANIRRADDQANTVLRRAKLSCPPRFRRKLTQRFEPHADAISPSRGRNFQSLQHLRRLIYAGVFGGRSVAGLTKALSQV